MKNARIIVTLASAIATVCRAANPVPLPESVLACAKLQDAMERVHCYDSQIAALTHPAAAAPAIVARAVAAAPPLPPSLPPSPQFGDEQLPLKARSTQAPKEEALLSNITEMHTVGQKIYLIVLANGQVWRQEGSQLPALFKVGNEVKIEKGAMGSYHLSTLAFGDKNWVMVTRTH